MKNAKKGKSLLKNLPWLAIGTFCLFLLFALIVIKSNLKNAQTSKPGGADIYFEGEYRVNGGAFNKLEKGQHIPATKGDVTLRGRFYAYGPDGEKTLLGKGTSIAFFLDHVNVRISESGQTVYDLYNENSSLGSYGCGEIWLRYALRGETDEPVAITVRNPHAFGNATAVDSLLESLEIWTENDFESEMLKSGEGQRYLALLLGIGAIILLGIALFSTLARIPKSALIWLFGFITFFAGLYLAYSTKETYFRSEIVDLNTAVKGISEMYYMLFVTAVLAYVSTKTQGLARAVTVSLGIIDAALITVPLLTSVCFYSTLTAWAIAQSIAVAIILVCMIREIIHADMNKRIYYVGMILPLFAFGADAIANALGVWKGGTASKYVFIILFIFGFSLLLLVTPRNIHALRRAKETELERSRLEIEKNAIEAELKESRVAIMLSQIRPHFIYNTLGTIERLCLKDPQMAFDLVRNFSLYLRGNFSELDSVAPIRFFEEIKHVEYYVNIEKVRFPDMTIEYQLEVSDFALPAISVQPLVENAIKHGLMPLETGGRVVIRSYETESHFCVEVSDNGVGFDTEQTINKKEHVGLYNIKERLRAIVNGDLTVESTVGVGTRATIMIPKEETV